MSEITLTKTQKKALSEINNFISDPDQTYLTLSGYAGTGKTTLINEVLRENKELKIIVTATTNKAVKVLREKISEPAQIITIHSLLGIKPVRKGTLEVFETNQNLESDGIEDFDLVIIDEASMISSIDSWDGNRSLLTIIKEAVEFSTTKVLFVGDPAQLQPINESLSEVFTYPGPELTEIIRYGDSIALAASTVREAKKRLPSILELSQHTDIEVAKNFDEVKELFTDFRKNPNRVRYLCWRNATVDLRNQKLREFDRGETNLPDWLEGDILIANKPVYAKQDGLQVPLLYNSEEASVLKVKEKSFSFELTVRAESGRTVKFEVISNHYESKFQTHLRKLANKRDWRKFWATKNAYADVRHAYALTTHKSQGSTFDSVVVDYRDIIASKDFENKKQLLYVAITRAAKKVYLL